MNYCPNCGKQIEEGTECTCQSQKPQNQENQYQSYYSTNNESGMKLLKVTSIILIIFGALGTLINLLALSALSNVASSARVLFIYEILAGFLPLIFGIIGVRMAADKSKAHLFIIFGIIMVVVRIVDIVWALSVLNTVETSTIFGAILGCTLPVLFIVGGFIRKKA